MMDVVRRTKFKFTESLWLLWLGRLLSFRESTVRSRVHAKGAGQCLNLQQK